MVISRDKKYLFIELPRTGTTAIAKELKENYNGQSIISKHATLNDFQKHNNGSLRDYFIFSCVRNPMDRIVSFYEKCINGYYDFMLTTNRKKTLYHRFYLLPKLRYVKKHNPSFEQFFTRFYWLPYSDWSILSHEKFDYLIRFEKLNEDFRTALIKIGIEPKRDLPVTNKTKEKVKNYKDYYTESIHKRTMYVFGPFSEKWKYEIFSPLCVSKVTLLSKFLYYFINIFRKFYWLHLKK